MDYLIWNQVLLELALASSGENELNRLMQKAAAAFLRKLNCTHVAILQSRNRCLETRHAVPRILCRDPAYQALVKEITTRLEKGGNQEVLELCKELYYYVFPLANFGALLVGSSTPFKPALLNELLPITKILAQNCFAALDAALKRQAIRAELESERAKSFCRLQTEKQWLEVLFKNSTDAILRIDPSYRVEKINNSFQNLFGYSHEELAGKDITRIFNIEPTGEQHINMLLSGQKKVVTGIRHAKHGAPLQVRIRCLPIVINGELLGAYVIYTDITEQKRYEKHLEYLSHHDSLTGLYNRRFVETEIHRLTTLRQLPVAVIVGDVNGLKMINNVFGHQAGDRLLKDAARVIKLSCRQDDIVARYGGDEFLILLPGTTERVAEKIARRIGTACTRRSIQNVQLSISLGHAVKTKAETGLHQVIKEAEEAMYRQKLLEGKSHRNVIIKTMMSTLYEKSKETEEHSERLKRNCILMGRELSLSPRELDDLALLAMLHDIGKVNISERILKKKGPLTPAEFNEIKKHPAIGYRIVQNAPELSPVADYILAHHERWDGTGYPRGLKGENIPLAARILAVADAFDAMTHERSYRRAMSTKEAIAELKAHAGSQFDPILTDLFINKVLQANPPEYTYLNLNSS